MPNLGPGNRFCMLLFRLQLRGEREREEERDRGRGRRRESQSHDYYERERERIKEGGREEAVEGMKCWVVLLHVVGSQSRAA